MQHLASLCALGLLANALPAAQHWFDAPRHYLEDTDSRFGAGADVDLDGDQDLIVFEGPSPTPGVTYAGWRLWTNTGAGEFDQGPLEPFAAVEDFEPAEPGLADLTGDGLPELILRNDTSPKWGITYRENLGGGSFGPAVVFSAVQGPIVDTAAADLDGDGDLELALLARQGDEPDDRLEVFWLNPNAAGAPVSARVTIFDGPGQPGGTSIACADIDGNGTPDIVVASENEASLQLFPSVGGAPTLGAVLAVDTGLGFGGMDVLTGDAEGDGDIDLLALTNGTGNNASVQWVLVSGGVLALAPTQLVQNYDIAFGNVTRVLADWDGDGFAELLGHGDDGISMAPGSGAASFGTVVRIPTNTGDTLPCVGPLDLDGDGRLDFVTPHDVAFGNGVVEPVLGGSLFGFSTSQSAFGDHLDDGDLDIFSGGLQLARNNAQGLFESSGVLSPSDGPPGSYSNAVLIADEDGDGRVELLARFFESIPPFGAFIEMRWIRQDGQGGFTDGGPGAPPGVSFGGSTGAFGFPSEILYVGDLTGDGEADLIEPGGYVVGDDAAFFDPSVAAWQGEPLAIGDVEPDGDLDVLLREGFDLRLARNDGAGNFSVEVLLNAGSFPDRRGLLVDLDADGDLEALVGVGGTGQVHVLENTGAGWTDHPLPALLDTTESLFLDDLDGDGLLDLIAATNDGDAPWMQVFQRLAGSGIAFAAPRVWVARPVQQAGDIDGDGDLDYLGQFRILGRRFVGPEDGSWRQYGEPGAASQGAPFVLGANGPLRPDNPQADVRLRNGYGGALTALGFGLSEASLPNLPVPGITGYIDPFTQLFVFPLGGTPGVTGAGEWTLGLQPFLQTFPGATFYLQAIEDDPTVGFVETNGLELQFGL